MTECFRCGVSGEDKKLYDAIFGKGIVKICEDCAAFEKLPIISKPVEKVAESEKQKSVRDRLIGMNKRFSFGKEPNLRDLVDQKFKDRVIQPHPDLVENFHWTIQRIRRARRISREEFAKAISEPDATIRMVEQGFLPDNNYKVITKIENYFGISLRKNSSGFPDTDSKKFILDNSLIEKKNTEPKKLGFDRDSLNQLKISDLKEMKKKQEEESKNQSLASWEDEWSEEDLDEE
jgi:ribosome-binding protein aMBF1 (putative translation factor)